MYILNSIMDFLGKVYILYSIMVLGLTSNSKSVHSGLVKGRSIWIDVIKDDLQMY